MVTLVNFPVLRVLNSFCIHQLFNMLFKILINFGYTLYRTINYIYRRRRVLEYFKYILAIIQFICTLENNIVLDYSAEFSEMEELVVMSKSSLWCTLMSTAALFTIAKT